MTRRIWQIPLSREGYDNYTLSAGQMELCHERTTGIVRKAGPRLRDPASWLFHTAGRVHTTKVHLYDHPCRELPLPLSSLFYFFRFLFRLSVAKTAATHGI